MDLGLDGKRCVVTGASSGIGYAVAARLVREGARVLLVARTDDKLLYAATEVGGEYLAHDVTAPDAGEVIIATAVEQMGGIDVLVNNAGTSSVRPLEELTDADWQQQWELNVMAPMHLMAAALPHMVSQRSGRIVNVASSSGKRPSLSQEAPYSVTKAAELALSRWFADRHVGDNVLINAVTPGALASELWLAEGGIADQLAEMRGTTREEALQTQRSRVPIGRLARTDEIADVIVFLCSARASFVAGAAWSIDGGTVPVII